jgi:hypothetical protein
MESSPTTGGAPGAYCSACGARMSDGSAFCHRCGAKAGAGTGAPPARGGTSNILPWSVAAFALIALVVLVAAQFAGNGAPAEAAMAGAGPGAIDIASMSPEEQANRLFNRVMQYSSDGKSDSAKFFAPMAISAMEALAPLTTHLRYDLGLVGLAAGDAELAAAQADTILKAEPTHLLGLILGSRAAEARGATAARKAFDTRLLAAEAKERVRGLPEYQDHDADIRVAIQAAQGRAP